jgi:predicted nucleotidyltransferase component of viral defense system
VKDTIYYKQAELVLRILPYVNSEKVFALKGGTAINFFVRDLPRISVDIDLTYVPINSRDTALEDISRSIENIARKIKRIFPDCILTYKKISQPAAIRTLIVNLNGVTIKIEPNLVIRGTIYEPEVMQLSQKAQNLFEMSVNSRTLSVAELYAGKICAALDRQHPRDLFDVHLLFENEGIDEQTRKAFLVYLISHPRPIVEVLNPTLLDIGHTFENEFKGMTSIDIELMELLATRKTLVASLRASITEDEKQFLLSLKMGKPEWDQLGLKSVENFPAVKWKLLNIRKMEKTKHKKSIEKLRNYLEI